VKHLLPMALAMLATPAVAGQAPPERFTIAVNDADLKDVLRAATADTDLNLIFEPGLPTGIQGLNLKAMALQEILDDVLPRLGLACTREGRNLYIHTGDGGLRFYHVDLLAMNRAGGNTFQVNASGQMMQGAGAVGGGGSSAFTSSVQMGQAADPWAELESGLMLLVFGRGGTGPAAASADKPAPATADQPAPATVGKGALPRSYASNGRSLLIQPSAGLVVVGAEPAIQKRVEAYLKEARRRTQRQVLLEARIVEVTLGSGSQMGVDWQGLPSTAGNPASASLVTTQPAGPLAGAAQGLLTVVATSARVQATLTALAQDNRLKVLSAPRLSTLNNQKAVLRVVREEVYSLPSSQVTPGAAGSSPIATSQIAPLIVPVGIILDILPQIGDDGVITLAVNPSISDVSAVRSFQVPGASGLLAQGSASTQLPVVDRRDLDAVVRIRSGETLVLAGMIQNRETQANAGVPWLRNLPLLGALFSRDQKTQTRTELAIFITPTLLDDADQVAAERAGAEKRLDAAGADRFPRPPGARKDLAQP